MGLKPTCRTRLHVLTDQIKGAELEGLLDLTTSVSTLQSLSIPA